MTSVHRTRFALSCLTVTAAVILRCGRLAVGDDIGRTKSIFDAEFDAIVKAQLAKVSQQSKQALLRSVDYHNHYRRKEGSSNMKLMVTFQLVDDF